MLDDLKMIHDRDAQDALGIAEKQWQQLQQRFELPDLRFDLDNIVFAGMGGSALEALVSQSWPGYKLPFEVVRDYVIPNYVSGKTLFIASSYSGNTEETVAAMQQAAEKSAHIVVIASGGQLAKIAAEKGYPICKLPTGFQPRHALWYSFRALIAILEQAGVLETESTDASISKAASFLQSKIGAWRPDVPTAQNSAKQLAQELMGKSPVIYAGPKLWPAAYKWKISFNENAKNVAWCDEFSEFNHNEFLGWTSHPTDKPYAIIELESNLEHPRISKRFEVTNRLLSGRWPEPHVIKVEGETLLEQLLWAVALGDFVSLYLALLNGINPTPVDLIEQFKQALDQ